MGKPALFENLQKVIRVVDDIRDCGIDDKISLPRIWTQSSGKSSLIESIVGIDFLPRGEGVCTRRPIELRLNHVPTTKEKFEPYATFPTKDNKKKYTDFHEVCNLINVLTDEVAGQKQNIADDPIVLSIFFEQLP